ncbi:MAG: HU family DNA-binding protein, partial [Actinobacteria bacterium]|nr:HU family DNA-binding protein [Actinomycetota bacterium]
MTKHELAKQVAAASGLSGEQAKRAVDAAFDAIAGELA